MQKWDKTRNEGLQKFIHATAEYDKGHIPVIQLCLDDMDKAANEINSEKDAVGVTKMYKSGYFPPSDVKLTTYRDNIDILCIKQNGIYHIPSPRSKLICNMPRRMRSLLPYQQWRECKRASLPHAVPRAAFRHG